MGLLLLQQLCRGAKADELLQDIPAPRVPDAGGQLAVRKGPRSPLSKLDIAFLLQRATGEEGFHRLYPLLSADIAGVDADGIHATLRTGNGVLVVEVDVRHQGNVDPLLEPVHRFRRRLVRNGHPDDLAPGLFQGQDLAHRGRHVVRLGIAHGLNAHRGAAAHRHAAHHQSFGHGSASPLSLA